MKQNARPLLKTASELSDHAMRNWLQIQILRGEKFDDEARDSQGDPAEDGDSE